MIGYCELAVGSAGREDEPELAFELLQEVHGRGYATEAARAVVIWADGAGYRRLWAGVWDWNLASRRVLHKVGFRDTGRVERESEHGQSLLYGREQAFDGPSAQGAGCHVRTFRTMPDDSPRSHSGSPSGSIRAPGRCSRTART